MYFSFDSTPISDNVLYANIPGQARRFLSAKGKKYKQDIQLATSLQIEAQDKAGSDFTTSINGMTNAEIVFSVVIHSSWYTKSDSIRKKDISIKALVDSIFNALKQINPTLDDSQIFFIQVLKMDDDIEKTEVSITLLSALHQDLDLNNLNNDDDNDDDNDDGDLLDGIDEIYGGD